MPNRIFYNNDFISVADHDLSFIIDESLAVIDSEINIEPKNIWLIDVQEKWQNALLNQGHNLRNLQLDLLLKDEPSRTKMIQILEKTRREILSLGEFVPSLLHQNRLRASDYYNVNGVSTQVYSDIIGQIIDLIQSQ
ncbi:hypothetical protein [Synechococcus sp. PCC 7336]|uniref:hypothetical protein n=1 Tax=Synechococcus sp. PCC 7336 TaxID=195250 RepID=UPI000376A833|nr:hypothetical protein [Synechococcus sp. PCC 7336]